MDQSVSSSNQLQDSESETKLNNNCRRSDQSDQDTNLVEKQKRKVISQMAGQKHCSPAKKRARNELDGEEISEEIKKEERRAANRLSAFHSRQRRKSIIADLQVRIYVSVC